MATPIGHALAGYAVLRLVPAPARRRSMLLLALTMANTPDLDFLPGLLVGAPALYHQGPTHSLAGALAVSLVAAGVCQLARQPSRVAFAVGFLAYASHLALDLLNPDARAPYGLPLFWPVSDAHVLSPVALLPGVRHAPSTGASTLTWLAGILDPVNLWAVTVEIVLIGPLAYLAWRRPGARDRAARLLPAQLHAAEDR